MNELNKYMDLAKNAKLKDRLVDTDQIIGITNKIPIGNNYSLLTKGSIMKLAAVFVPLITIFTIGFINADNLKTQEENRIAREKGIEGGTLIKKPIFHPSKEELEDFGIYIEEGKVIIYTQRNISWYNSGANKHKIINKNYNSETDKYIYSKSIQNLSNWRSKSEAEILKKGEVPFDKINKSAISLRFKTRQVSGVSGLSNGSFNSKIGSMISNEIADFSNKLWSNGEYIRDKEFVLIDTDEYQLIQNIMFVSIPLEIDGKITEVFTAMIPTNELYNSISINHQKMIDDYYEVTDYLDAKVEIPRKARVPIPKINKELLSEVSFIQLSSDELKNIGIQHKDSLISLTNSRSYKFSNYTDEQIDYIKNMMNSQGMDTSISEGYFYMDQEISYTSTTGSDPVPHSNGIEKKTSPEISIMRSYIYGQGDYYSYNQGATMSVYNSNSENKTELTVNSVSDNYGVLASNNMNTAYQDLIASYTSFGEPIIKYLLPVRVFIGDKNNTIDGNIYGDILLFYRPTEDFINSLPTRYSEPLSKEFGIITSVENGEMNLGDACDQLDGNSYFGICSNNSFALMNLYPMPVNDKAQLDLVSSTSQNINIDVMNNTGKVIINLSKDLNGGKNQFNLDLSKLSSGVYFLKLSDSSGNTQIRTFIKN